MNGPARLTDEAIRRALTPPDDDAIAGLAESVRAAVATAPRARLLWWPSRAMEGLRGGRQWLRVAIALALLAAVALAIVAAQRLIPRSTDVLMFHGGAARTGEMVGPGPQLVPVIDWEASLQGPLVNTMPALQDGRLFVFDGRGHMVALDAATGAPGWATTLPASQNSPAVVDGMVVVGAGDGLYGLDPGTGRVVWSVPSTAALRSSAAIVDGIAFVGFPDGSVVALDAASGAVRWRTPIGGAITRALAVADGLVFAGGDGGTFAALDARDGTILWSRELGPGQLSTPAVSDGVVVVATGLDGAEPHALHAIDVRSSLDRWTFTAPTEATLYVGGVSDGVTYAVGLDGWAYALIDGQERWRFDTGGPIGSVATISEGLVYVSSSNGRIYALEAGVGTERWMVTVEGDPGPVVVADRRMYVGTTVGQFAAFGEPSP